MYVKDTFKRDELTLLIPPHTRSYPQNVCQTRPIHPKREPCTWKRPIKETYWFAYPPPHKSVSAKYMSKKTSIYPKREPCMWKRLIKETYWLAYPPPHTSVSAKCMSKKTYISAKKTMHVKETCKRYVLTLLIPPPARPLSAKCMFKKTYIYEKRIIFNNSPISPHTRPYPQNVCQHQSTYVKREHMHYSFLFACIHAKRKAIMSKKPIKEMYSRLHLECHSILISNFVGLFSTGRGKRDWEN